MLNQPHHDGSELYVERLGDSAELRLRAPEDTADAVLLRYVPDGHAETIEASVLDARRRRGLVARQLPLATLSSTRDRRVGAEAEMMRISACTVIDDSGYPADDAFEMMRTHLSPYVLENTTLERALLSDTPANAMTTAAAS